MKLRILSPALLFAVLTFTFFSCDNDDDTTIVDSSMPTGSITVERSGSLVAQSGTPTSGTVELIRDEDGEWFLHLGSDFTTDTATGTLSAYFSTSDTYMAAPGNGNPDLILAGIVTKTGEQFFKLDSSVSDAFTHVIIWCNSASIPFGNAELQ